MKKVATEIFTKALDTVDGTVTTTTKRLDVLVEPARTSFARRYPTLFSFIATAGVAMTFLGIEQLLLASSLLERYPIIILALGIGLLFITGSLYTKLK
jgi:uncharacterized protein (DUF3084 family)